MSSKQLPSQQNTSFLQFLKWGNEGTLWLPSDTSEPQVFPGVLLGELLVCGSKNFWREDAPSQRSGQPGSTFLPSSPSLPPQGVPRFWVLRPLFFFLNSSSCSCCCRSLIVFLLFSILPLMLFLKHPAADVSALQYLSGGRKLNSLHSHGEFIYLSHCLLCPRCSLTNSRKGIQA